MAMNNVRWGDNIAAAVLALNVQDNAKITDMQLKLLWRAVAGENITEISGFAKVAPGSFQIINPETNTPVPVTGIGEPIT
jgi:hypothetical protein